MVAGHVSLLRRCAFLFLGLLCMAAASMPARAQVGAVVVVARGQFTPGDDRGVTGAYLLHGNDVQFANLDKFGLGPHTMTAVDDVTGDIIFDSGTLEPGDDVVVQTSNLAPGTYRFFCSTHYFTGTLHII